MDFFQEKLLTLLKRADYSPTTFEGLVKAFKLEKTQVKKFRKSLYLLLDKGQIVRVKKDRFALPNDLDLITGTVKFKQNGSALLFPETSANEAKPEPFLIKAEDTHIALPGDLVVARLVNPKQKPLYYKGYIPPKDSQLANYVRIVRIIKRGFDSLTGTLQKSKLYYYVIPDDPQITKDFIVDHPEKSSVAPTPKVGDKVVFTILEWEHRHLNPLGRITAVLGQSHTPQAEFLAVLKKYRLETAFPEGVIKEALSLPTSVHAKDTKNRMDCTSLFTLTIDPEDAKDFDDALSYEALPDGNARIGVHIADVGAYVLPNSQLDLEAQRRGNSTYLVGSVIPMLPFELSQGLCSLVEQEVRLTKSVFLTYTLQGQLKKTEFANTFIKSQKRLSYKQAYAFLTKDNLQDVKKTASPPKHQTGSSGVDLKTLPEDTLVKIQNTIRSLWSIAKILRSKRMASGSLDLDMPEVKILLDPNGYPDRIEQVQNDESHQLIEEFMLCANEAVAKLLYENQFPYISRVHEKPDPEKLEDLSEILALHQISVGDLSNRNHVNSFLSSLKEHPEGHTLKIQFLRSLKQACYRAKADGHYGLNKVYYAHFTSPIRRYADLIVHRVLDEYLIKSANPTALKKSQTSYTQGQQENFAKHITQTEQNSAQAERESIKIKLLEYFEIENKKPQKVIFEAIITDLRNYGFFVELKESMAYGLVHISSLKDDIYTLLSNGTSIAGRRSKKRYALGQTVFVVIDKVDRYKRQLDFKIADSVSDKKDIKVTKRNKTPALFDKKNTRKQLYAK